MASKIAMACLLAYLLTYLTVRYDKNRFWRHKAAILLTLNQHLPTAFAESPQAFEIAMSITGMLIAQQKCPGNCKYLSAIDQLISGQ